MTGPNLATTAATAREAAIAWRKAAMRAQLEHVPSGEKIPPLNARPGPHVPVPNCKRGCRPDRQLCRACGRACPSCGEPSRFPGGSCDPCFTAVLRVVPTDVVATRRGRR